MAKKIEGWADIHLRDGLVEGWFGQCPAESFPKATLIMGEEAIFTQSELVVIVNELEEFQWFTTGQLEYLRSKGIRI